MRLCWLRNAVKHLVGIVFWEKSRCEGAVTFLERENGWREGGRGEGGRRKRGGKREEREKKKEIEKKTNEE